jgi:predicted Zn-dependent protease
MNSNSNLGTRLIVGIVIALIGYAIYMNQTQVNPVTGEKQHISISTDQEIRLGLESAPEMARQMGGEVPASDPRTMEVQKIGQYLVAHTKAADSPWKFKFHLIADTKSINAFALPGGQVFITLGLLNELQNEAQLAGVLGHEMGHVIERHSAEQMAKSQLGQMFVVAVGTAANSGSGGTTNAAMVAAMVNHMFQLRYSRNDESEADTWGLKLTEQAGFNPHAMIDVMKILKASAGTARGAEIFQTHPNPDLRIQQINAYLKEHPPRSGLSEGKPLRNGVVSSY